MTTYRERRTARAERLREWADGRDEKAAADYAASRAATEHIPFGQPILVGHHSEAGHRADLSRAHRAMDRSCEHAAKAASMRSRADSIEQQARGAIYSDDDDAADRLRAKIAGLEAKRDEWKAANAAFRKAYRAELAALNAYERTIAVPHPPYAVTNIGATIRAAKARLAKIEAGPAAARTITARYAGECADCGAAFEAGATIRYARHTGALCAPACETAA